MIMVPVTVASAEAMEIKSVGVYVCVCVGGRGVQPMIKWPQISHQNNWILPRASVSNIPTLKGQTVLEGNTWKTSFIVIKDTNESKDWWYMEQSRVSRYEHTSSDSVRLNWVTFTE